MHKELSTLAFSQIKARLRMDSYKIYNKEARFIKAKPLDEKSSRLKYCHRCCDCWTNLAKYTLPMLTQYDY